MIWRKFNGVSYLGKEPGRFAPFLPKGSPELLLRQILRMPKGKPISYEEACRMVQAEGHVQIKAGNNEAEVRGSSNWLTQHWVEWLSQKGFHIELTGEEFDIVTDRQVSL